MKFVFAVVMLALAAGVQSSLVAQVSPGVSYVTSAAHPAGPWAGAWGPWAGAWGAWNGPWAGAWNGPAPWGVPGISLSQGPAHAAPLLAAPAYGHSGVYVAKTRGAIHTAPLAGHVNSATSLNLAPAPGTH